MAPVAENPTLTWFLFTCLGSVSAFLAWLIRKNLQDARDDLLAARKDTVAARVEAKEERETMRKEVVETLKELSDNQEAQYVVTDGLIRHFREEKGLVPPEEPQPALTRPQRPRRGAGGD